MKRENWIGRNKKFGERSKPSGSLGKGKGDADLSSFPVLPSALFASQFFLFNFFLLFHSVFDLAHTVVAPGCDFFTKCFFFFNEIPLKMCQVFGRSASDNSPILLTSYTDGKFKVDTTNAVTVCTVGRD